MHFSLEYHWVGLDFFKSFIISLEYKSFAFPHKSLNFTSRAFHLEDFLCLLYSCFIFLSNTLIPLLIQACSSGPILIVFQEGKCSAFLAMCVAAFQPFGGHFLPGTVQTMLHFETTV
jgi:hypothetical protein